MYEREIVSKVIKRIKAGRKFIQVLAGPRQTGKTTIARQVMKSLNLPAHYVSADEPMLKNTTWLEEQWQAARIKTGKNRRKVLLVLDEIQKIPEWSETVKRLWDEDTALRIPLCVLILGSSPLLIQHGLSESLAGRFEVIYVMHWTFIEMHSAFGWDIDKYIFFGGYPGSAGLIKNFNRWSSYIKDSLIETTLSRDILLMTRVDKPALLRRLFEVGCLYSGQILSYQKIMGQLQDAGNTTTLAHYLELLNGAGLLTGLQKYAGRMHRRRASSPKFQVLNNALKTAQMNLSFKKARNNREIWGRLVESAVGAELYNSIKGSDIKLFYWAAGNYEVDFILQKGEEIVAIEVKSGRKKLNLSGMEKFSSQFRKVKKILVGDKGIPVEQFLKISPRDLF